ncbi:effector binding domain-containing protein [Ruminococcaceae bacterium OttesenSCG-928-L11]|nr:effector binding domain-containing protein [Ruminococcaceae bacterium OttesenSCG-928-L11]
MADIARIMCCSSYNVQRMFSFLAGIPLSEYIRNRRLTLAAVELQQGTIQVNDVSVKYGYNSPTAFTRAFAAFHGLTPNEAKQAGATLKVYPRMTFSISITGGKELDYRIETIPSFSVVGIEIEAPLNEDGFQMPQKLWLDSFQNGAISKLCQMPIGDSISSQPHALSLYGISNHKRLDDEHFSYMIACPATQKSADTTAVIPEHTYVMFKSAPYSADDRTAMQKQVNDIQRRFYGEWLPTVSYEKEDGPELEVYYQDGNIAWLEMWYPIRKGYGGQS